MNRLMDWLLVAALLIGAVILIMFVTDPNMTAETIYELEMENNR